MSDNNVSVSIITISQLSRNKCLSNLSDLINCQDYTNIIEWVIVEGSSNEIDGDRNYNHIKHLSSITPINYIKYTGESLSELRNIGNQACSGDIIVCMDDDDYYPPTRVSHAVESLLYSGKDIAGCTAMYMYDYDLHKLYRWNGFGPNHSTNSCIAFTQNYLKNHTHEKGLFKAEEHSFTNGFTAEMVQLDPEKCIVLSSHGKNTVNKKTFCNKPNDSLTEIEYYSIGNLIPLEIFNRMCSIFQSKEHEKMD